MRFSLPYGTTGPCSCTSSDDADDSRPAASAPRSPAFPSQLSDEVLAPGAQPAQLLARRPLPFSPPLRPGALPRLPPSARCGLSPPLPRPAARPPRLLARQPGPSPPPPQLDDATHPTHSGLDRHWVEQTLTPRVLPQPVWLPRKRRNERKHTLPPGKNTPCAGGSAEPLLFDLGHP